jgi:HAD superfamily hydrolase (TIGR01484 family)
MRIVTLRNTDGQEKNRLLGDRSLQDFTQGPMAELKPLSEMQAGLEVEAVKLLATDMDGTLTQAGRFRPELLGALWALKSRGLPVVIVTGRSAGWVSGLAQYLPVAGAICENGGAFFRGELREWLVPMVDVGLHREKLRGMFEQLRVRFPQIGESADNAYRLTDWTFDVAGLSLADLGEMEGLCEAAGWSFTYSTVQCHIKLVGQEKAAGILWVMEKYFPGVGRSNVLVVGDSPNDQSMFGAFPMSVGVANLRDYLGQMEHWPQWVTQAEEGAGFCELVEVLLGQEVEVVGGPGDGLVGETIAETGF